MLAADNANIVLLMGYSISNSKLCLHTIVQDPLMCQCFTVEATLVPGAFPHLSHSGSVLQMC